MKRHSGVDAESGFVHTIETVAANEADISITHKLLHGKEKEIHGDEGYIGVQKRQEFANKYVYFFILRYDKQAFDGLFSEYYANSVFNPLVN